jgi:hypothetical protein
VTRPWSPGAATGIGSLPGTDPVEAAGLVFGELPELPHLAELPARGAGAELVGRTAALLVDLPVEVVPSGWRLTARPSRDLRRARDYLAWDLDALETRASGYEGALKLQLAGPWTLAAALELPSGHKVLSDRGATRDLAESLGEGLRGHLADVLRRVPGAEPVVQWDEPSLPAVLSGEIPTPSGYGTVAAVEETVVEQALRTLLEVGGTPVVHCCAARAPIALLRRAGAQAVSVDAAALRPASNDELGAAIDAGMSLWLGVLPARDAEITLESARTPIRTLWQTLGFAPSLLAQRVVPTPACGLAGATPGYARRVLALLRDVGSWLLDVQ